MRNLLHTLLEFYAAYALLARLWLALLPVALLLDTPMEYDNALGLVGMLLFALAGVAVVLGSIGLVWGLVAKLRAHAIEKLRFFKLCMVSAVIASVFGLAALGMILYQVLNTPVDDSTPEVVGNMLIELCRIGIVIYTANYYMKYFSPEAPS